MKEGGSPVAKGKGSRKHQLNSKYVMNDSESDTEKQVKQVLITYKTHVHAQLSVTLLPQAVSQTFRHIQG